MGSPIRRRSPKSRRRSRSRSEKRKRSTSKSRRSTSRSKKRDKSPAGKPKVKGLVSDRNRSSSSSSSDSDAAPGPKRERSLSVGSKEILAYRREQEMRQQRELDKLKGIKIEEAEVKEVVKGEEDSDSETEWKKSKPLAEKLKTVISPPAKVIAPVVASEVVQKPVKLSQLYHQC